MVRLKSFIIRVRLKVKKCCLKITSIVSGGKQIDFEPLSIALRSIPT